MDADDTDDVNADNLADGLGSAANGRGLLNPMIVVQAQIFQIVNGAATVDDMLHGWTVVGHTDSVTYSGSTTGTFLQFRVLALRDLVARGQGLPPGISGVFRQPLQADEGDLWHAFGFISPRLPHPGWQATRRPVSVRRGSAVRPARIRSVA